jgi:hypothetical protein
MLRVVGILVVLIFTLGVFMIAAPAGIEQVGGIVEDNSAVEETGVGGVPGTIETVLFVGVPLMMMGGFMLWGLLRLTRRERFTGQRGGGLR